MAKNNLRRIDLAKFVSKKKGFSLSLSKDLIDKLIEVLIFCITRNRLILKNIGTFSVVRKNSRIGRNPKTKQEHIIKAHNSIMFKPSQSLLKKINN